MDALITLVLVSIANLVTLESMAISEVKHDTGICRNIWPFSASREHNVNIKQLSYCNLPTMLTTRKPWSFWVVMMTGSSDYGSMTLRPWKSPETSGTASDADRRKQVEQTVRRERSRHSSRISSHLISSHLRVGYNGPCETVFSHKRSVSWTYSDQRDTTCTCPLGKLSTVALFSTQRRSTHLVSRWWSTIHRRPGRHGRHITRRVDTSGLPFGTIGAIGATLRKPEWKESHERLHSSRISVAHQDLHRSRSLQTPRPAW